MHWKSQDSSQLDEEVISFKIVTAQIVFVLHKKTQKKNYNKNVVTCRSCYM